MLKQNSKVKLLSGTIIVHSNSSCTMYFVLTKDTDVEYIRTNKKSVSYKTIDSILCLRVLGENHIVEEIQDVHQMHKNSSDNKVSIRVLKNHDSNVGGIWNELRKQSKIYQS